VTVAHHAINGTDPTSMYDSCRGLPICWRAAVAVAGMRPCGGSPASVRATPRSWSSGQNPGSEEDEAGVPFVGRGGDEFAVWLNRLGWIAGRFS